MPLVSYLAIRARYREIISTLVKCLVVKAFFKSQISASKMLKFSR
jgi:hypothetical protein